MRTHDKTQPSEANALPNKTQQLEPLENYTELGVSEDIQYA